MNGSLSRYTTAFLVARRKNTRSPHQLASCLYEKHTTIFFSVEAEILGLTHTRRLLHTLAKVFCVSQFLHKHHGRTRVTSACRVEGAP